MDEKRSGPPREGEHNAGAFLGPYGTFPADMRTLSDEIPGEPSELDAERLGPREPRPPRSLAERFLDWLRGDRR